MKPLRIEMKLAGPIARPASPIHLDSLIAHRLVARDLPTDALISDIRAAIADLPLERREIGGDWVWAASTIAFDWISPPMQQFAVKAVRPYDVAEKLNSGIISNMRDNSMINTASGPLKSATYAYEQQWASRAVAYCIGDEAELTALLGDLDQLGAKRRLGYGRVTEVAIVEDSRAETLWKHRNLPFGADAGVLAEGAYRLPLFDPAHRAVVRVNSLEISHFEG